MRIYSKLNRPIIIVDYNPEWIILFEDEKHRLIDALKDNIISVEHIGSTAVPGLSAKPVIDIALGIDYFDQSKKLIPLIKKLGYHYVPEFESILPERRFFWKGTDKVHTYHIHMTETTNPLWINPIIFRDYLEQNPDAMHKYDELKRKLADQCSNDIQKYINGKTEFIESVLEKAVI
ncbi:MAG: GrpB family protein [Calditrichaceae bacterium]